MTTNIKKLSEKLAKLYGVDAYICYDEELVDLINSEFSWSKEPTKTYLAEDSGRISDLADENNVEMRFDTAGCFAIGYENFSELGKQLATTYNEYYRDHPTKSAAARMARVRCLIAIGVK